MGKIVERAALHLFVQLLHDALFIGPLANKARTVLGAIAAVGHDTLWFMYLSVWGPNIPICSWEDITCAIQEPHNFAVGLSAAHKHMSYHIMHQKKGFQRSYIYPLWEPWLHCEVVSLRLSRLAQIAPLPAIGGSSIRSWDVEDINDLTTSKSRFTLVATNPNHLSPKNLNSAPDKKPYETVSIWSLTDFCILKLRDEWGHGEGLPRLAGRPHDRRWHAIDRPQQNCMQVWRPGTSPFGCHRGKVILYDFVRAYRIPIWTYT